MSKNVALFIDVANIYYAARGQDVDVDYVALLKHVTKGRDLIRAYAYSGLDPENENQRKFLDFLSKNGYKVVHKDIRKFGDGRVKANLDIELVVDLFRLQDRMDIAVIVSGDGDFASAMRALQDVGVRCEVISFRPNTSSDLIAVADEFTDIMKITGIGRGKGSRTPSMPEMPAKEVNPEFGFREASRGVAAAAIAALREGEKPARATRRRSSRATEEAQTAEAQAEPQESPATTAETVTEGGDAEGSRRRRRRRGGRGRGRGRGRGESTTGETGEAGEAGESGEIGWQEFDDVSALTDLGAPGDERDYSFEEADAETLAALGLSSGDAAAAASDAAGASGTQELAGAPATKRRSTRARASRAAEKGEGVTPEAPEEASAEAAPATTKPSRRRTSRTAAGAGSAKETAAESGETSGEPASEPDKPARRTRRTTSSGGRGSAAKAEATEEPAAKTTRTRTTRSRRTKATGGESAADTSQTGDAPSGESTSSPDGDADEGIWQRFRSARGGSRRTR